MEICSLQKPGVVNIQVNFCQCSAWRPVSSSSSRLAAEKGSSLGVSSFPAGISQVHRSIATRCWRTRVTIPRSSTGTMAEAPLCRTTSRRAVSPLGRATCHFCTRMIFPGYTSSLERNFSLNSSSIIIKPSCRKQCIFIFTVRPANPPLIPAIYAEFQGFHRAKH